MHLEECSYLSVNSSIHPPPPFSVADNNNNHSINIIKVGEENQAIYQIDKHSDGSITQQELYGVRYVPLTDRKSQLNSDT
jgi:protein-L-isoaspartate(D-aspartate) O-methyltransferase